MLTSNKRGQVTIFVIIAIVIIAAVVIYLLLRGGSQDITLPSQFQQIDKYYQSCIEELGRESTVLLGDKGGFIETPEFIPGNGVEPLSSQIDFFGLGIPYWIYQKDGGIKSQIPQGGLMEEQIAGFIESRLSQCEFSSFTNSGYIITRENPSVEISLEEERMIIRVAEKVTYNYGGESVSIDKHEVTLETRMGKMYSKALEIYNKELQDMFLEQYAVDIVRLYAPVDGVELSCSPLTWNENEIYEKLRDAIEVNIQEIKIKNLAETEGMSGEEKYFIQDVDPEGLDVRFIYDKKWISRMNIEPSDSGFLVAQPVGNQEGLGIIGFCYVPYHFVYDLTFPVMVQIFSGNEIFQYPMQVIMKANKPREAITTNYESDALKICGINQRIKDLEVYTYDSNLNPISAEITFKCISSNCYLGKTLLTDFETGSFDSVLKTKAPQCLNGFLIAQAEGYETTKYQISTNTEKTANILLSRNYELQLELESINAESINDEAVIYFNKIVDAESGGESQTKTLVWPEQKNINLSEGYYNVTVYSYKNSEITIPGTTTTKCIDVPRPGFAGILGATKEECQKITTPDQKISSVLSAGGKSSTYITESELRSGSKIKVVVNKFRTPRTIQELQENYALAESNLAGVYVY